MAQQHAVLKIVNHSHRVLKLAVDYGWIPGARYTNLRDVRRLGRLGFLDIDWKEYSFDRHLSVAQETRPLLTVARDIEDRSDLTKILDQAYQLKQYSYMVIVVPKDESLAYDLESQIPNDFALGYSVPTRYGGTRIPPACFKRPTHLLGGRPDVQRRLADQMPVFSVDGNRFTLDASFGDYFDGERFRPHPSGGYNNCLADSIKNINALWDDYVPNGAWEYPTWIVTQIAKKTEAPF